MLPYYNLALIESLLIAPHLDGAKIYLDDQLVGVTPATVAVPRKSECVIRIELEGYEPVIIDRNKDMNEWFLGNLLLGGVVGMAIGLIGHNQGGYSELPILVELKAKTLNGEIQTKIVKMSPLVKTH